MCSAYVDSPGGWGEESRRALFFVDISVISMPGNDVNHMLACKQRERPRVLPAHCRFNYDERLFEYTDQLDDIALLERVNFLK